VSLAGEFDYLNLKLLEPVLGRAPAARGRKVIVDLVQTASSRSAAGSGRRSPPSTLAA